MTKSTSLGRLASELGFLTLGPLLALQLHAQTAGQAGMFTLVRGKVTVSGAGAEAPARMMRVVHVGERVQLGADAQAVLIYFANGHREQLGAGCQATIGSDGAKVESGPPLAQLEALDPALLASLQKTVASGSAERSGGVVIRDAQNTSIAATDKQAASAPADAGSVTFGVAPSEPPQPEGPAPKSGAEDEPTKTAAKRLDLRSGGGGGENLILPEDQLKMARQAALSKDAKSPQDAGPQLVLAAVYSSSSMHKEAIEVLEKLRAEHPSEPALMRLLAAEYQAVGDSVKADQLRAEAHAIEAGSP